VSRLVSAFTVHFTLLASAADASIGTVMGSIAADAKATVFPVFCPALLMSATIRFSLRSMFAGLR
jgi:hypothetical protein